MADGGTIDGPVWAAEPDDGCYIPFPADQSAEYRERNKALWAELLTRWAANGG